MRGCGFAIPHCFLGENEYVIQKVRNSKDTEYTYIFCDTGDNILSSGVVNT